MADNIRLDRGLKNAKLRALFAERLELSKTESSDQQKMKDILGEIAKEIVESASFIVPAEIPCEPIKEKDGGISIPASTEIAFVIFSTSDGQKFIPIFSDSEAYELWNGKTDRVHTLTMDFPNLARLLERSGGDEGLVINPFSDNLLINRPLMLKWYEQSQIMSTGSASHAIPADKVKDVYSLNPYPFQLMNTLCEAARQNPEINAMWLRGINLNNEDSYLLIVDFTGSRQQTFSALGEAARKFLSEKPLHIVPRDEGFGGKATEGVTPIYTKE